MILIKAQGGTCPPELRAEALASYKEFHSELEGFNKELEALQSQKQTPAVKKKIKETNLKIGGVNSHLDAIRPFLATEVEDATGKEFAGGSSSRVSAPSLPGGQLETVDVAQKTIKVTMGDGRVLPVVVNTHNKEGKPFDDETLNSQARDAAMNRATFESDIGITQVDPVGRAASFKPSKRRKKAAKGAPAQGSLFSEEEMKRSSGLHLVKRKTDRGTGNVYAHFDHVDEDGNVTSGRVKVKDGETGKTTSMKEARVLAQERIGEARAFEEEERPAPRKKPTPDEFKDELAPLRELSDLPDHSQERDAADTHWDAHSMSPAEYRKEVNGFYRKGRVLESLKDTATKQLNDLRTEYRNTKDPKERSRLDNKRKGILEKFESDVREYNRRVDPKVLDAEHKKLVGAALFSDEERAIPEEGQVDEGGGWQPATSRKQRKKGHSERFESKRDSANQEAIEYHGLPNPRKRSEPKSYEEMRELGVSEGDIKGLKGQAERRAPAATLDARAEDHYSKVPNLPRKPGKKDLVETGETLERREALDREGSYDPTEAVSMGSGKRAELREEHPDWSHDQIEDAVERWWDARGTGRGRSTSLDKNRKVALKYVKKVQQTLATHRDKILSEHDFPADPSSENLTPEQQDLMESVKKQENKIRERLIARLSARKYKKLREMEDKPLTTEQFEEGMDTASLGKTEWSKELEKEDVFGQYTNPVFNALDDKSRKMIISEMRKSVTLYENPSVGNLMTKLFLDYSLFKALALSEDQKVEAFKNSFGRATSGVGPATMNTAGIGEKDKEEEEDEDNIGKSLNLGFYVGC